MDSFSEWKEYVFYPRAFDYVPRILSQLDWERKGDYWKSKQHLNRERDSRGDYVTSVSREAPYNVHHFGAKGAEYANAEGNVELIKYKALLEHTDYNTALRAAAAVCGLSVPSSLSEEDVARYNERQHEREAIRTEMVKALWRDTPEAEEVRNYLFGRKWTEEEIKEAGFGLITAEMKKSLNDTEGILRNSAYGTTNKLALTYWAGERIAGFAFRRTDGGEKDKYLYTCGMEKTAFLNVGYGGEMVIAEGLLDSFKAKVMGATNVVAAGGPPSRAQLSDAVKRGARVITLLYDKDAAGDSFIKPTIKTIKSLNEDVRVYVGALPESQDLDEYLTENGVERYNENIIKRAISAAKWEYYNAVERAEDIRKKQGDTTDKVRDELFEEVVGIYTSPKTSPQDLGEIRADLATLERAFNIDSGRFEELLTERREKEAEKARNAEIEAKIGQIGQLFARGESGKAREELGKVADRAREQGREEGFAEEFGRKGTSDIVGYIAETKDGLPTGFTFKETTPSGRVKEEKLTLNSGITFVCAPRGHGKTSLLNCMALNEARRIKELGTGESVLYFSYEISKRRLWADLLKAFINDPYIKYLDDSIRHFCRNYQNPSERARYISGKDFLPSGFDLPPYDCFRGNRAEEITHKAYFEAMQEIFFTDLVEGDILKVVDKTYKVEELLAGIRWHLAHTRKPVSVIFIDYAQLIYSENWTQRREEEIKKVVHQIKDFSEGAGIPFVMAAQFNRKVQSPASVDTANIGEGGDFERIADTIIGLYNLKELRPRTTTAEENNDNVTRDLLVKAGARASHEKSDPLEPREGKIFATLLKRRYGDFPLYACLDFEGRTKHVKQNDPGAAFMIDRRELTAEVYGETGQFDFFGEGGDE